MKAHKREQANKLPQGAASVAYGNPIHLVDAAQCIKLAWEFHFRFWMQRLRMRSTLQVQVSNVARWRGWEIWYCGWLIVKLYSIDWILHLYSPITRKRRCAMLCTNPHPLRSWPFSKLSNKIRISLNLNCLFLLFRLLAQFPPFPTLLPFSTISAFSYFFCLFAIP